MAERRRFGWFFWLRVPNRYRNRLALWDHFLEELEGKHHIRLTPAANEIMFAPLIEMLEEHQDAADEEIRETFERIFDTIAKDPDVRDDLNSDRRTAWSVLKAMWKNWCDIPPICRPTKR